MDGRETGGKTVVFCGTRGVPANYGGFETAVDEISRRFVERGYDCAVVCRRSSADDLPDEHEGRRLIYVEGSSVRTLDTFVSALQTGLHLLRRRKEYGHVFWFNNANLPGILLTLAARLPVSVNTDGMEWRRAKWKPPFKAYYFLSSALVSRLCRSVISDSRAIQSYYKQIFRKKTQFVPYGVPQTATASPERQARILRDYGLEPGRYLLQITRFEPDNLPLECAEAFRDAGLTNEGLKFLLVGYQRDWPYAQSLKSISGQDGVLVADAVYDPEVLYTLRANCFSYVHGNSVGGTNPALLEAMASCPRVTAVNGPFSREGLGEAGYYFRTDDMEASFAKITNHPDSSAAMRSRVSSLYRWDEVAESYMRLAEGKTAEYLQR